MDLIVGLNEVPYADFLVASELDEDAEQWLDAVGPLVQDGVLARPE